MTPTDADRERARLLIEEAVAWGRHNIPTPGALLMHWRIERSLRDKIAAALAEARRGALTECARWHDEHYVDLRDNGERGPNGLASGMTGARMYEHREAAEHFRALAASDQGGADERG